VAKKKSDKYPYQWSDGTFHSITEEKHVQNRGKPLSPPPGSYDPNLDIQEGQANRGLGNLLENLDVTGDRALEDYGIGNAAFDVQGKRNQEDYDTAKGLTERGYARQGADLSTALKQGGEDYGTNVAGLQRQYKQLGDQQGGQQRQAGAFAGSGAAIQAARKRVENEAYDRAPIDTAYSRFKEGNALAQTRLGEDQTSDMSTLDRQLHRGEDDITVGRGGLVTACAERTRTSALRAARPRTRTRSSARTSPRSGSSRRARRWSSRRGRVRRRRARRRRPSRPPTSLRRWATRSSPDPTRRGSRAPRAASRRPRRRARRPVPTARA
jgi:hypothetical protein